MRCPYCANPESKVVDSRPSDEGTSIRRRRECLVCHRRFTTYETMESIPLVVIKRDGSRQAFDKGKVLGGMLRACEKRPVAFDALERIADEIEQTLQNEMTREITTTQIGEMVMERLRNVDEVAYIRFVSVYRQFKDISTFMEELRKLLKEK
ncbi:MAG TPA: transcriptional regulator NrdR [Candidatus Flavonifractor merdigallinarum]|uniref:Transcriptional repressor NrdR n=1 Tax=Candidatus Flavonifractor merdigallinarum TaxID=2838589 RepID=A0A9D2BY78_9FIRM|nr:transcriptional regulator NrdR [Candidatus Flavonifractor merdigallinarum]